MTLPVLMYHNITLDATQADFLTIPAAKLEQQLQYIRYTGYTAISLGQFHQYLRNDDPLPRKSVLLTFDDGYKSNLELLYPLLQQYGLKAGIFLVTEFVSEAASSNGKYLSVTDLQQIDPAYTDFGYHSYNHNSYGDFSVAEAEEDVKKMQAGFKKMNISIVPLFAYPYGASPRKDAGKMAVLQQIFAEHKIDGAFRIGNRLSKLPIDNKYQIQRIDVRGTDPFWKFKLMLRFGRKWLA